MPSGYQNSPLIIRHLGLQDYAVTYAMREFIEHRMPNVVTRFGFTTQLFIRRGRWVEHILSTGDIPVVKTDRGDKLLIMDLDRLPLILIDLKRLKIGVPI